MLLCFCAIGSTRVTDVESDGNVRGIPNLHTKLLGFSFFVVMIRMLFSGLRIACQQYYKQVTQQVGGRGPVAPSRRAVCVGLAPTPRAQALACTHTHLGSPGVRCSPRPRALGRPG